MYLPYKYLIWVQLSRVWNNHLVDLCFFFFFLMYHSFFIFFKFFIVIQLKLSAFSPHPSTPPQLNPPPSSTFTLPLDFVHVSFIVVPVIYGFSK